MPPVDDDVEVEAPEEGTTQKSVIGIIYPPPEVRSILLHLTVSTSRGSKI